ncbi:MAG: sigma-54-dependent Fis family transcriptional regulator [Planctomycetes bacterium]|nr:sigma-54-dependent Fis family transcriptional regulator [Planctomycetota bacterium]
MPTLLVIDDEAPILHAFRRFFREPDFRLLTAPTAAEGLRLAAQHKPDAVVLDLQLPDLSGKEVFRRLREADARVPVVFMTGHGTAQSAIEAMKDGAYDYLLKPIGLSQVRDVLASALQISRLMRVPALLAGEVPPEDGDILIGRSAAMQEVYKAIGRVATQDLTVLIQGESGTGKELVARAVYQNSRRASKPLLTINCAAIPEPLLESELFGHEKGAFTGADRQRIGKFEQTRGGTLFLDEVGDMTPLTQAKVLRVLQEQRFERVGGNETIQTDVRVIAASNRDLAKMAEGGQFRADLYYRLSGFAIALPPLRERGDDLPLLVEYFLKCFSKEMGKEVSLATAEVLELLCRYPWPGNVRELQSVLRQSLLRARGSVLLPEFLPSGLLGCEEGGAAARAGRGAGSAAIDSPTLDRFIDKRLQEGTGQLYAEFQAETERYLISRVMRHTGGNQLQAALLLGIQRGKLRSKLRALGLPTARSAWSKADTSRPSFPP